MSYQDELMRLEDIITADDSTNAQRTTAREAKTLLIDSSIEAAFERFQARTQEFDTQVNQLRAVVDKIAANQLTGIIDTLNNVVSEVQTAARGSEPDDEG
jgi:ABC-type transporter Mla subunit MlaD